MHPDLTIHLPLYSPACVKRLSERGRGFRHGLHPDEVCQRQGRHDRRVPTGERVGDHSTAAPISFSTPIHSPHLDRHGSRANILLDANFTTLSLTVTAGAIRIRPTSRGPRSEGNDPNGQQLSEHGAALSGPLHGQRRHAVRLLHEPTRPNPETPSPV